MFRCHVSWRNLHLCSYAIYLDKLDTGVHTPWQNLCLYSKIRISYIIAKLIHVYKRHIMATFIPVLPCFASYHGVIGNCSNVIYFGEICHAFRCHIWRLNWYLWSKYLWSPRNLCLCLLIYFMACLYSAVSLTLVREQRFIRTMMMMMMMMFKCHNYVTVKFTHVFKCHISRRN